MNKDDNIEGGKEKLTQEYEEAQNELKELVKLENDYLDYVKKESIFCVFTLFLINQLESNGYLNWRQAALGKTRGRLKSQSG